MQIKGYLVIFVVYIYDYFLLYAKSSAVMLSLYASFPITLLLLFFCDKLSLGEYFMAV